MNGTSQYRIVLWLPNSPKKTPKEWCFHPNVLQNENVNPSKHLAIKKRAIQPCENSQVNMTNVQGKQEKGMILLVLLTIREIQFESHLVHFLHFCSILDGDKWLLIPKFLCRLFAGSVASEDVTAKAIWKNRLAEKKNTFEDR